MHCRQQTKQQRWSWLGLIGFMAVELSVGSSVYAAGQTAVYLREGAGARALGMGNAQTTVCQDASATYWNPALLAIMPYSTSIATQTAVAGWERSWNFISAAGADPIGQPERFAYAASWMGFSAGGDLEGRTINRPEPEYMFRDSEQAVSLSAAKSSNNQFSIGTSLKFLTHELDNGSASGMGWDVGAWYRIAADTQAALVLQDIYSTLKWTETYMDRVPLFVRLGVAQAGLEQRLLLSGEVGLEYVQAAGKVKDIRYRAGAEYRILPDLALRAGVDTGRWTLGVGWRFSFQQLAWIELDYAVAGERATEETLTHFLSMVINIPPQPRNE